MIWLVAAVAVLAGCTGSSDNRATTPTTGAPGGAGTMSLLFVQTSTSGTLEKDGTTGDYALRLIGVNRSTSWFSDRPQRQAGSQSTSVVTSEWDAFGFGADPPNAALVLTDQPKTEDTIIVELRQPLYDDAAHELRYRAHLLDAPRDGLASATGHAPKEIPTTFAAASLFIDDAKVTAATRTGNDLHGTTTASSTDTAVPATTVAPSSSDPSTSAACTSQLAAFTSAATAGTYTSTAQTIAFPTPATLQNPAAPGATGAAQSISLPFVVNGVDGTPVAPSATAPVTVSIYGAPAGSIQTTPAGTGTSPVVVTVTSGSTITVAYDGAYLSRPLTVMASMPLGVDNVCTATPSFAIGSTTMTLAVAPTTLGTVSYSTPTVCASGTSGAACATANVDSDGLALTAVTGYGATVPGSEAPVAPPAAATFAAYTVDTGSIGTVLPRADLGPNAVGPGAPALKYYDSSGNEFIGFVYLAPVTLQMGSTQVTTDPIRVLAVLTSACHPDKPCTAAPPFAGFHYLGIGFDRSEQTPADPFRSPADNALLAIDPAAGGMSQGYVLSGGTIQAGITSANSTTPVAPLTPSSTYPGDWQAVPMCVTFPTAADPSPPPACGSMLMDVGIPEMFITFSSASAEPAAIAGGLASDQTITINAPSASAPALTNSFSSGPAGGATPPATAMAPSKVEVSVLTTSTVPVFINTGRHVLFQKQYVFNAQAGTLGFAPLVPALR